MRKIIAFVLMIVCLSATYVATTPNVAMAHTGPTPTPTPFLPDFSVAAEVPIVYENVEQEQNETLLKGNWQPEILAVDWIIVQMAGDFDLNPRLMASTAVQESGSGINCPDGPVSASCTGDSGEMGPMQCMPYNFEPGEDPRDLLTGFRCGARVLREAIDAAGGNIRLGLAAYNCGPNGDFATNPKCLKYADDVLGIFLLAVGHNYPETETN